MAREFRPAPSRNRLPEKLAAIGWNPELDTAPAPDLLRFYIHLDYPGVGRDQAVAAARRHPDAGPKHDHQVGALITPPLMGRRMDRAERAEAERMVFGEGAARLGVGHHGDMREFSEL